MIIKTHIIGFSKIDYFREIKFAIEDYWNSPSKEKKNKIFELKKNLILNNWKLQIKNNLNFITLGDFSFYDHILDSLLIIKCLPERFNINYKEFSIDNYFELTRGNNENKPMEMKKWFNTNYHYMVPEYNIQSEFSKNIKLLKNDINLAKLLNYPIKFNLIGPLTILKLGKIKDNILKSKLLLLPKIILSYISIIKDLNFYDVKLIQIEEPILNYNISKPWIKSFKLIYSVLSCYFSNIMLVTYFGEIKNYFNLINNIPFIGLHIDCIDNNQIKLFENIKKNKILSLGLIDGKNIWKNNLELSYYKIKNLKRNKIYISSSCSLMHSPITSKFEENEIKNLISFNEEKLEELKLIKNLFKKKFKISKNFIKYIYYNYKIRTDLNKNNNNIQKLIRNLSKYDFNLRDKFKIRNFYQRLNINLPILPTTNIGSFPQTKNIRKLRLKYKKNLLNELEYNLLIKKEINFIIKKQLEFGFDVLVHGEPERNDMVEYFSNYFKGFFFTNNGWVQSYGTRYVKPPIIYADLIKNEKIDNFLYYSENFVNKIIKSVITGPLTIFKWSFNRKDQPSYVTCLNISLIIKNEILNLEKNNVKIIQIDEPAIREFLPFKKNLYYNYFNWTKNIILLTFNKVENRTQIHSHICYSEFNNIINYIEKLDFDVISIETYRSNLDILKYIKNYNNNIGLGLYDIHSKRKLKINESIYYIKLIINYIRLDKIWINPDCGLKTRKWKDIIKSLNNMIASVKILRNYFIS